MKKQKYVLEVENISKSFKKKLAVDKLNLQIEEGKIWGMVGSNGAGKTTAIRMMCGLVIPDSGTVKIGGYDLRTHYIEAIGQIGVTFEDQRYYENLTAMQNVKLAHSLCRLEAYSPLEIMNIVGLDAKNKTKVSKYSTGMRKRLGLAFAMISKPRLIMLDEPTNGLDPTGIRNFQQMMQHLAKEQGVAFLISSHLLHDVERICDGVLILKNGITALNCDIATMREQYGQNLEDIYFRINDKNEDVANGKFNKK